MAYLPGNFRQRVQELLKQHDMNAEDLAKLLGVSTDTVRRMLKASEGGEDGSPKVSVDAIVKIQAYGYADINSETGLYERNGYVLDYQQRSGI